jgi:hypothetical protein
VRGNDAPRSRPQWRFVVQGSGSNFGLVSGVTIGADRNAAAAANAGGWSTDQFCLVRGVQAAGRTFAELSPHGARAPDRLGLDDRPLSPAARDGSLIRLVSMVAIEADDAGRIRTHENPRQPIRGANGR